MFWTCTARYVGIAECHVLYCPSVIARSWMHHDFHDTWPGLRGKLAPIKAASHAMSVSDAILADKCLMLLPSAPTPLMPRLGLHSCWYHASPQNGQDSFKTLGPQLFLMSSPTAGAVVPWREAQLVPSAWCMLPGLSHTDRVQCSLHRTRSTRSLEHLRSHTFTNPALRTNCLQ